MDLHHLTSAIAVSPQLEIEDIAQLAAHGVDLILCNRPDSEVGPDQSHHAIEAAARGAGIAFRYLPLTPGGLTPELVADFRQALSGSNKAVAYCRSGTRSATLWALSQAGSVPAAELVASAARAGYDLRHLQASGILA